MSAPKLVESLRLARLAAQITPPLGRDNQIDDIRAAARMARHAAYNLAPLNCDDLAHEVDDLATAVHMLATAVLRLCGQIERGARRR
jgi:hypothetical protein